MASSSSAAGKILKLVSNDGVEFIISEAIALQSQTILPIIEDGGTDTGVTIPNVSAKVLSKVLDYCKVHAEPSTNEDLNAWDAEYMKKIDINFLFDLLLAANYLEIKELLDLACQTVADMIKDKSVEDVRTIFNIENDFAPEEEEELREENRWAFHSIFDENFHI